MNINDVQQCSQLVHRFGVKAIIYGGPGTGKTPMLTTIPNSIIAFTEPGLLSIRKHTGAGVMTTNYKEIRDFWMWAIQSREAQQFQTKCSDSVSQMAEIILQEEFARQAVGGKGNNQDPRNAYGEMAKKMMELMNWIYYAPNFNAALIAKEGDVEFAGESKARPYFPGKDLNIRIPHLFDSVWRVETLKISTGPFQAGARVVRTRENFAAFARDRSGNLNELEQCDLSMLFSKSMQ